MMSMIRETSGTAYFQICSLSSVCRSEKRVKRASGLAEEIVLFDVETVVSC